MYESDFSRLKTMSFIIKVLFPIVLIILVFWLYLKVFCSYRTQSSDADLVCSLNYKDGLFLVSSYIIIKILSRFIYLDTIVRRLSATLILYTVSYGLIAGLYWFSSFFQKFETNTFFHFLIFILLIEILFRDTVHYKSNTN